MTRIGLSVAMAVIAGVLATGCGKKDSAPAPTAPTPGSSVLTVSAVSASAVAATSAVVRWMTDRPSTSRVEYGLTTAYGASTSVDPTPVLSHLVGIDGLQPGSVYHFRVTSTTSDGASAASANLTFTTAAEEWNSAEQFSDVQGANGWLYRSYFPDSNTFVDELRWTGTNWMATAGSRPLIEPFVLRPEGVNPGDPNGGRGLEIGAALSWRALVSADFRVSTLIGDMFREGCSNCNGVEVRVWVNSGFDAPLFTRLSRDGASVESFDLGAVHLQAGDELHLVVLPFFYSYSDATVINLTIAR